MKSKKVSAYFEDKKTMKTDAVLAFICAAGAAVTFAISNASSITSIVEFAVLGICAIYLHIAFSKYEKHVVNGLVVIMLTIIAKTKFEAGVAGIVSGIGSGTGTPSGIITIASGAVALLIALLSAVAVITHLSINSTTASSPQKVNLNQMVLFLLLFFFVVETALSFKFGAEMGVFYLIGLILSNLAYLFITDCVVCAEVTFDSYRSSREKGEAPELK